MLNRVEVLDFFYDKFICYKKFLYFNNIDMFVIGTSYVAVNELFSYKHIDYWLKLLQIKNDTDATYDAGLDAYFSYYEYFLKYPHIMRRVYRIYNSRKGKARRIRQRIIEMAYKYKYVLWLTFTFNNDYYYKLNSTTKRRYVDLFCRSVSDDFVGNKDIGDIGHREHYHVILGRDEKLDYTSWAYGALNGKLAHVLKADGSESENDTTRISKYIDKVVNHYIKDSASKLIYSRQKRLPNNYFENTSFTNENGQLKLF